MWKLISFLLHSVVALASRLFSILSRIWLLRHYSFILSFSRIWLLRLFRAQCQFSPVFDWYVNLISHAFSAFSCIGLLCWYLTYSQFSTSFDYNIPHTARSPFSPFSPVFNFFFSISRIPSFLPYSIIFIPYSIFTLVSRVFSVFSCIQFLRWYLAKRR